MKQKCCEHHDDFHIRDGCYGLGQRGVMVNTNWGPEPFEEPICSCERHLAGQSEYVLCHWREERAVLTDGKQDAEEAK